MSVYVPINIYKKDNDDNLYTENNNIINKSDLYFNDNYLNLKKRIFYPHIFDDSKIIYTTNNFRSNTLVFLQNYIQDNEIVINVNDNIIKDLIKTVKSDNYLLYRGLKWKFNSIFLNEFYNSEKLYKVGDNIDLDLKKISSWSLCKNVAEVFSEGFDFGIVISINIQKEDVLADLSYINQGIHDHEWEVLVKPKLYSCIIESLTLNNKNVNSMEEWGKFTNINNKNIDNSINPVIWNNKSLIKFLIKQENDSNYNYKVWYNISNSNEKYRIIDTFIKKNIKELECKDIFYKSLNLINQQAKKNLITCESNLLQRIVSQPCEKLDVFKVYYVLDLTKKELVEFFNNFKNRKIYKKNEECEIKINKDFICNLNYDEKYLYKNKYGIELSTTLNKSDIISCDHEKGIYVKKGRYNFKIYGLFLDNDEITSMDEWASSNFKKLIKTHTRIEIVDSEEEYDEKHFVKSMHNYYEDHTLINALEKNSTPEIIKKILNLHPDINVDINGWTPLMYALRYSTPEIINRILDLGADVNFKNDENLTPLMLAIKNSTPEIINKLLDLSADVNVNTKGWTPLMLALRFSTPDIINRLLDLHPDVNVKHNTGFTPLMIALEYQSSTPEIIERIRNMLKDN